MLTASQPQKQDGHVTVCQKVLKGAAEFWKMVFWTDQTQMNLHQSDGKKKVWRPKGSAQDPKHSSSSVEHGGVMVWACTAATGSGPLIFTDDGAADGSCTMSF